jgi:glycosyltransferase involved in cell wall biosynthesis
MNIGIDAKRIFFNNSGLGNYSRRFYHGLSKKSAGDNFYLYSPELVAGDNPYLKEINPANSLIISPNKPWHRMLGGTLWRSGLINARLIKDNIGIYYGLSNEIPFGNKNSNIVRVVIIHDLIFLRYPQLYPAIDAFFYKQKTRYACKNADFIITASEQTKRDVVDFYHVPENKITVIYPGSDPIFYSKDTIDASQFFSTKRRYIISIGAITPRKNLLKTVQAFNLVKDRYDLDLVVIGTAVGLGRDYLKTILNFLEKNELKDRVHFLENVPYKYVPALCRNAQLMVYPSQFEGFGMPIVEGLFSNIPVITSRGGCFPEAGGDGAVYVNPDEFEEIADWIEKLMNSETLRNELVTKGRQYAEKFKQENIETDIINFHRSIKTKADYSFTN